MVTFLFKIRIFLILSPKTILCGCWMLQSRHWLSGSISFFHFRWCCAGCCYSLLRPLFSIKIPGFIHCVERSCVFVFKVFKTTIVCSLSQLEALIEDLPAFSTLYFHSLYGCIFECFLRSKADLKLRPCHAHTSYAIYTEDQTLPLEADLSLVWIYEKRISMPSNFLAWYWTIELRAFHFMQYLISRTVETEKLELFSQEVVLACSWVGSYSWISSYYVTGLVCYSGPKTCQASCCFLRQNFITKSSQNTLFCLYSCAMTIKGFDWIGLDLNCAQTLTSIEGLWTGFGCKDDLGWHWPPASVWAEQIQTHKMDGWMQRLTWLHISSAFVGFWHLTVVNSKLGHLRRCRVYLYVLL